MIAPELMDAYNKTEYRVSDPSFVIRIGETCAPLDELLNRHQLQEWAFITAYNPRSVILPDAENQAKHAVLKEALRSYLCLEGEGVGEDPPWKPERSLLVLGIGSKEAADIGNAFDQNAIVVGALGSPARLLILK
jgi:hypothetical protein